MRTFTLSLLAFLFMGTSSLIGQNTIVISLDASLLSNPDCWLNQGVVSDSTVYIHSGLCVSAASFCSGQVMGSGSMGWEHVKGNWGMDDGVGKMTFQSGTTWTMNIDLDTYYTTGVSAGSTPMPNGATPYIMGLVFRDKDGTNEGKDDQCGDIFITGLNTNNPQVVQGTTGASFPAVTVTKLVSVEQPLFASFQVYPNPATDQVRLSFDSNEVGENAVIRVFDLTGKTVAVLDTEVQTNGLANCSWQPESKGLFLVSLINGNQNVATRKVIVQ